jgi:PadR family transcriptional regulator PadR
MSNILVEQQQSVVARTNTTSQLKKGLLDLCVLSLLRFKDYYGYNLVTKIAEFIEITEGTIYPLLKRLRDNELVVTYEEKSTDGAPRKYYKITEKGLIEFELLYKEWREFRASVDNMVKQKK